MKNLGFYILGSLLLLLLACKDNEEIGLPCNTTSVSGYDDTKAAIIGSWEFDFGRTGDMWGPQKIFYRPGMQIVFYTDGTGSVKQDNVWTDFIWDIKMVVNSKNSFGSESELYRITTNPGVSDIHGMI